MARAKKEPLVAGKAATSRPNTKIKKEPIPGVVNIKTEPTEATAKHIEWMTSSAKLLKVETPKDWPEGTVPNVHAFGPLPTGWHHAKRVTNASSKGSGGKLHPCFVGPRGSLFWHKRDLEKYLGEKIKWPAGITRRAARVMSGANSAEFPPNAILRHADKAKSVVAMDYIKNRCKGIDGMAVSDALSSFRYSHSGKDRPYTLSDLRYDVKGGRIIVEKTRHHAAKSAAVSQKLKELRSAKRRESLKTLGAKSVKGKPKPVATKSSVTKRLVRVKKEQKEPQSTTSKKAPRRLDSKPDNVKGVGHLLRNVFTPLKKRAASGSKADLDVYALLGVGHQLKMDKMMLSVLPEVLRKAPSERGEFGALVMRQFEDGLRKQL